MKNPAHLTALIVCMLFVPQAPALAQTMRTTAQSSQAYTLQSLYPQFLNTQIPSYLQYAPSVSPATYEPANGDFLSQFTSPSGQQVSIVIKAPVINSEYDVPPIASGQDVNDYLNNAMFDSNGNPLSNTLIKFPTGTYNFTFPLNSNCNNNYVHWQPPSGATDLVIDGQGSTVNFSDFCLGLNLPNVNRVTLKNFTFAWPNLQLATVGTIVAAGGNGTAGYTYDVHIPAAYTQNLPGVLAAINAWDSAGAHWNTVNTSNVSYGDGVTSSVPLQCVESAAQQQVSGCTAQGIPSYGVQFQVGQSVLLRHYDFATAISASGTDITFDNVTIQNSIGAAFLGGPGRGFRITNSAVTPLGTQPISAAGNGSLITGESGDVVYDHNTFNLTGDDPFDMNSTLVQFTPAPVNNTTPMNTFTFNSSTPNQLQWPVYSPVQSGDTIALFDETLAFQGVINVQSTTTSPDGSMTTIALNSAVPQNLAQQGFIATDITSSGGARYLISNNTFKYTSARALLLQTPLGWVDGNVFIGQTMKSVYVLASRYWGEGPGAQDVIISNNVFDCTQRALGFYAVDIITEAPDFPNSQDEVTGVTTVAPSVNQNIVVAGNVFTSDQEIPLINVSSANNVVFSGNTFSVPAGAPGQLPVTIHGASNVHFADATYGSWLTGASCANSPLLLLSNPAPVVSIVLPNACGIAATVSGLTFSNPSGNSAPVPQSGYWWNPAESGRGYVIEYNGTSIFMAAFLYDASGRSTWYGAGPAPLTGSTFTAPLLAYSGGQTLTGSYQPPSLGASPGNITITFSDGTDGTLTWPGGTIPITRFAFAPNGLNSPPTATQPQTGWWFNPNESGRGYSIEVQGNQAFVAAYMYDALGNPVWYDSGPAALIGNNAYQGNWVSITGGQTLTGSYQAPTGSAGAGSLTIQFSSPTAGMLTLPNGNQTPIQRFGF